MAVVAPQAVEELSFENILASKKAKLQELLPVLYKDLQDSDPAISLLEVSSYSEGFLRERINKALLACMLDYSSGSDLDNLGLLYGIERKLISQEDTSIVPVTEAVYESDDALRERIKQAPSGFSVAGPKNAYIHYGLLADEKVKDVNAISEEPMEVKVAVLSYDGNGQASAELLEKVNTFLNADNVRPIGDLVTVQTAEVLGYQVEVEIVFKDESDLDKQASLTQIEQNLSTYTQEKHKISSLVALSGIYAACFVEGVKDVVIVSPTTNVEASALQAPYCTNISVIEEV